MLKHTYGLIMDVACPSKQPSARLVWPLPFRLRSWLDITWYISTTHNLHTQYRDIKPYIIEYSVYLYIETYQWHNCQFRQSTSMHTHITMHNQNSAHCISHDTVLLLEHLVRFTRPRVSERCINIDKSLDCWEMLVCESICIHHHGVKLQTSFRIVIVSLDTIWSCHAQQRCLAAFDTQVLLLYQCV